MGNATNETTKKTNWLDAIKAQFKRIIWPTKEEAARRSAVVLAVSVLLGVIIAVLDRVLLLLTDVIISQKGENMADRNEYLEDPMWYVVHTYSGYENKVKTNIDKSIQNLHLEDQILDVQVPVQEVIEVKDGKKKTVQKKLFPGYVLLHMIMNDETWYVVRNTRGVTGFVGPESKPVPLTEEEMTAMGINMNDAEKDEPDQMILVDIEEGDMVNIVSGAWQDKEGIVQSVNSANGTVTVGLDMFGRETAVEISFLDIRKM